MKNNTKRQIVILISLTMSIAMNGFSQSSGIIAEGAKPQLISSQFSFTEGPAVDKKGNVYFTDQPNNKIWKYDTNGQLSVFMDKAGRSNGMYFDKKGNLITCADEHNEIWSISPDKKVTVLLKNYNGHVFNGPNDLWIDKKGGMYFTDPYFQRDYWERKSPDPEMKGEKLYYLPKGKTEAILVDPEIKKPNGLIGTPDNKYLYVSDMGNRAIIRYDINVDGTLTNKKEFAKDLSDGMTIDNQGNVYLAGRGVIVYNSDGKKIEQIDVPAKWTANVCFGGKNMDTLFITASESVFILPMKVKGVK